MIYEKSTYPFFIYYASGTLQSEMKYDSIHAEKSFCVYLHEMETMLSIQNLIHR